MNDKLWRWIMRKTFSVAAILAMGLALSLALGGCGSSDGDDKDTGGAVEEVKADAGPSEVAPEEVAPEEVAPEDQTAPPEEVIEEVTEDIQAPEDIQEDTGTPPIDVVEEVEPEIEPEDIQPEEIIPGDACLSDEDKAIAADAGAQAKIVQCLKTCYLDLGEDTACVIQCIADETGLSPACSECFGYLGECTVLSCPVCIADSSTQECADCRNEKCSDTMLECSGVDISAN